MRQWIRSHLTYSNVISTLCLFLLLGGGTAVALDGSNTVFSDDIVNGEVKNADIGVSEVKANSVAPDSLGGGKITDRSVKNADLALGASSSNTIADGGIQGVDVKNDTLTGAQVDESTLFNDDSLNGGDINEASLTGVNASQLGGIGASGFIQGGGRAVHLAQAIPPGNVSGTPTLAPGFFDVDYSCGDFMAPDPLATNGTIHLFNDRNQAANLFIDNGLADPQFTTMGATPSSHQEAANKSGELITFQLQWGDGAMATIWVATVHRASDCHFQVQALITS
jgi:hypothetical protein